MKVLSTHSSPFLKIKSDRDVPLIQPKPRLFKKIPVVLFFGPISQNLQ